MDQNCNVYWGRRSEIRREFYLFRTTNFIQLRTRTGDLKTDTKRLEIILEVKKLPNLTGDNNKEEEATI